MAQNLVGILLNADMHRGVPRQKTGQESLSNYEEAAAAYDLVPCYLKLADIDTASGISAAYIKGSNGYKSVVVPTPAVIHNRAIYNKNSQKMQRLLQHHPLIYNTCNRYGKDEIHELLKKKTELHEYLPTTTRGSGLRVMMNRYSDLILKPCRGSIGNGVMRLIRTGAGRWRLSYFSSSMRRLRSIPIEQAALPKTFRSRLNSVPYLVQERIPLAEIGGRPFDLRVTVQRGWGGDWLVTGLFAKLAAPGGFVSNIARGGEAVSSSYALEKVFSRSTAAHIRMSVEKLSLAIAGYLEQDLPGLADIGLDIGITKDGRIFFIECNGRDQRYGFHKAGLTELWKESYRRPMGYARFLLEKNDLSYNSY